MKGKEDSPLGGNNSERKCSACGVVLAKESWRKGERNSHHLICASCARSYARNRRKLPEVFAAEKERHRSWLKRNASKARVYFAVHNLQIKLAVLRHYSSFKPSCKVCGVDILASLALDHTGDDGTEFRRKTGIVGHELYWYLMRRGFPDGFQVLCSNCNHLKRLRRRGDYYAGAGFQLDYKREAIAHYTGGAMACQDPYNLHARPLQDIGLLTLDHMRGGGRTERQTRGNSLYWWLIRENYPGGYRILCMNCQMIAYEEERFRGLLAFLDSTGDQGRGVEKNA